MKLISYIILLFTLFLTGCDSDDNTGKSILDLGIQDISFEANGGSREVSINLNGNWLAVSDKSWCTVGKNANKLTLTAPLNLTIATRTAVITITEGNGEGTFTVIQAGSKFDIFPEKLYVPASGKGVPIAIKGNVEWEAQADESWCHPVAQGDTLMISADTYKDEQKARYATVTVQVDGQNARIIPVIQTHYKDFNLEKWSDTNEGATLPSTPTNLSGKQFKQAWGNYYQWGRNVEFPCENVTTVTTIAANSDITAAQAQQMPEFITHVDDWLCDGSLTTKLPTLENTYGWTDRSGSNPCRNGYRLPYDYECLRIFPGDETPFKNKERMEGKDVLDIIGTEYDYVSISDGASKIYIIKMFGTSEAYVIRYEFKGISSYNGWIRLTEIKGNADTDFQTAGEAENLFTNATRSAELCFPICGVLWGENAEVASPGTSGYWNNTPSYEYKTAANAYVLSNIAVSYATSYRRSLGCMIRGIKE